MMVEAKELSALMTDKGFDVAMAMEICVDDPEIYLDVLLTALSEGRKKLPLLGSCLEEEDYQRYRIEVHALKNAARAMGADQLSHLSAQQEESAKNNDTQSIRQGGRLLIEMYERILVILEEILEG